MLKIYYSKFFDRRLHMSKAKQIIGFIGLFVLSALAMEDPTVFINVPSLVIVFGMTACALLFTNVKQGTAEFWRLTRLYAMGSGGLGTLIGFVLMLGSLEDPAAIGPSLAVAILTVLYAVFIGYFIALPMEHRCRNASRLNALNE
jgi:flagellar motor component MotA